MDPATLIPYSATHKPEECAETLPKLCRFLEVLGLVSRLQSLGLGQKGSVPNESLHIMTE